MHRSKDYSGVMVAVSATKCEVIVQFSIVPRNTNGRPRQYIGRVVLDAYITAESSRRILVLDFADCDRITPGLAELLTSLAHIQQAFHVEIRLDRVATSLRKQLPDELIS